MRKVIILRDLYDTQGTPGRFISKEFNCYTLELPWRNNRSGLSCIPGNRKYIAKVVNTPKHGFVYMLQDTEPRVAILEHSGNWAGDIEKGFKTHVLGCILLGKYRGLLQGQRAVLYSRPTVKDMMRAMSNEDMEITVINTFKEYA